MVETGLHTTSLLYNNGFNHLMYINFYDFYVEEHSPIILVLVKVMVFVNCKFIIHACIFEQQQTLQLLHI